MKRSGFSRYFIYRLVPFLAKHPFILIFAGLIYLVLPIDLFPEMLTGIFGLVDDALILSLIFYFLKKFKIKTPETGRFSPSDFAAKKLSPYEVLEISPEASEKEIKEAYRKKMAEYHPDKVAHLGKDLKKTADQKTKEIQEAYQQLTKNK